MAFALVMLLMPVLQQLNRWHRLFPQAFKDRILPLSEGGFPDDSNRAIEQLTLPISHGQSDSPLPQIQIKGQRRLE